MGYGNENSPFIKVDNKELKQKLDQDFNNLSQNFQTDINQFKQQTSTQLADKVSKNETETITWAMISQDARENIAGEKVAVVAKDSVTTPTIVNKSVTPTKTSFLELGKNLFNKKEAVTGKLLVYTNGTTIDSANYFTSGFIPLKSSTKYTSLTGFSIAFYDEKLTFISGLATTSTPYSPRTFTTPSNAVYVRISSGIQTGFSMDNFQLEEGETPTSFEEFNYKIKDLKVTLSNNDVGTNALQPKSVTKEKLNFSVPEAVPTKNLYNEKTTVKGYYVNWASGAIATNASYVASEFIPVTSNGNYSRTVNSHIAFYDNNKLFISGTATSGLTFTTPANTAFIRISVPVANTQSEQIELGNTLSPFEPYGYKLPDLIQSSDIILNLPSKIYGLVGQELNIYFDNIVSGKDKDYDFDVICSKGQQFENFFRIVPDVKENRPITINVYKERKLIKSVTSTIIVSNTNAGSSVTKSVLVIGDSTTNSGFAVTKLNENFSSDAMNIALVGTRGTSPNLHEGRSGWKAKDYVESASVTGVNNAFWNPSTSSFDFSYYISSNSLTTPSYVIINLGINDTFSYESDELLETEMSLILSRYTSMINSIKAHNSNIKIGIAVTIPPNYSQDAFGKAYGAGQTRTRYKRNNILWVNKLLETYKGRESENLYLIPIHINLDTRYNFGFETIQVNKRNSMTVESPIANGGVHPVESGYWQIADSYWYFLKGQEV